MYFGGKGESLMETVLWWTVVFLSVTVLLLLCKIYVIGRAADEIRRIFSFCLREDTNLLITVSCRDKKMRALAEDLNRDLRLFVSERRRFLQGDRELKTAVTNISHDLRTPLTSIYGYLDLLQKQPLTPEAKKYCSVIAGRAEAMTALTEELFDYSVILSSDCETAVSPTVINDVLAESLAAFYPRLCARKITPEILICEEKVIRPLNRKLLSRVFSNLLTNAVKYSDGDLSVTLSSGGEIVFSNAASELGGVEAERLFDRFFTVRSAGSSTGLGLSIAKTLVRQMNGKIFARYEKGRLFITLSF